MLIAYVRNEEGETIAAIPLQPKTFSTGSKGFHGQAKVVIDGKPHQVQCQAVEIGSKPGAA